MMRGDGWSGSARARVMWFALSAMLATVGVLTSASLYGEAARLRAARAAVATRDARCPAPSVPATPLAERTLQPRSPGSDPPVPVDPEGTALTAVLSDETRASLMRVSLDVVREDGPSVESVQLGSRRVIPSNTITVLNLWASWCGPCTAEFREFRDLFTRKRESWGNDVGFVPIQVGDTALPDITYRKVRELMPEHKAELSDQNMIGERTLDILDGTLYRGELPVTLVLDCRHRVVWARSPALSKPEFVEFERTLDRLHRDLSSPECATDRCGDGACQPGERRTCPEDCDTRLHQSGSATARAPPPTPSQSRPDPRAVCRRRGLHYVRGSGCVAEQLAGGPLPPATATKPDRCVDDGRVGEGEDCRCADVPPCKHRFECQPTPAGPWECRVSLTPSRH